MSYLAIEGGIGRLEADGSLAVLDVPFDLATYLASGGRLGALARSPVRRRCATAAERPATIVAPGAVIYGIGLNYRSKQEATGRALPEHPTLFVKAASALAAPGGPIVLPATAPACVDYEGEIAVVVGAELRDASPGEAFAAVSALLAANDVTARDVMRDTGNPMLAKSFPGFCQLGSAVLDPDEVGRLEDLELSTTVNGELRQHDRGVGMVLGTGEVLAVLSRYVLLRPGDIVLTGTPAGTGEETKDYLHEGDLVEVRVGNLLPLRSTVGGATTRAGAATAAGDSTDPTDPARSPRPEGA